MVQVLPVMQRARSAAEDMQDRFQDVTKDGVIDEDELLTFGPVVMLTVALISEAGDCQVAAMAVLKGGVGSYRAEHLLRELDETYQYDSVPA